MGSIKSVDSNPAGRRELLESIAGYRRDEIAPGGLRVIAAIHDRPDYIKKRRARHFCHRKTQKVKMAITRDSCGPAGLPS